jgi:hypothetical protein
VLGLTNRFAASTGSSVKGVLSSHMGGCDYPTVLPRPIGGYYWAIFTSRRSYGTIMPVSTPLGIGR